MTDTQDTTSLQEALITALQPEGAGDKTATITASVPDPNAPKADPLVTRFDELQAKKGNLSLKESLEKAKLKKKLKARLNQSTAFEKMMTNYRKKMQSENEKMMAKVGRAAALIGKENFNLLKDIYTTKSPEVKDDAGNVTQPAQTNVNYAGVLKETEHVIVLNRQHRITTKQRKSTSGSSKQRRAHRDMVRYLNKRTEDIKKVDGE